MKTAIRFLYQLRGFAGAFAVSSTLVVCSASAETQVGGNINSSVTWTTAGSPYLVTNSITVRSNATLTIQAGVVIRFNSGLSLTIAAQSGSVPPGYLVSQGTSVNPVVFTSYRDDQYGGSGAPQKGDWRYIYVANGGNTLENCLIRYAGDSVNVYGAVRVYNCNPIIRNNTIEYSSCQGISAQGMTSGAISNNVIRNCTAEGIYLNGSSPSITGNIVQSCAVAGIHAYSGSSPAISGNVLSQNAKGVLVASSASNPVINHNDIVGNTYGVTNSAGHTINARNNWWGSASGPGPVGPGSGDKVSINVDYGSWLSNSTAATSTADYASYLAPGEKALLSKPILLNDTPYQVVGITTSALAQFTDLFDPATYWQPPVTLSDPFGGSEPSVIGLKTNISTAFLVHYYSNGVWQICSDEFTRAWVYHLALAEVQAHYRSTTISQKGVYSADTAHYAKDLAFRDTEAFWFPTCWGEWLPLVGDGEQRKFSLAAFEEPLEDYTTFGLMSFFGKQYLPLPIDTKTKDFAARITDGTISVAKVLDFEKRRYQYIPPVLGKAKSIIGVVGTAWELTQDLQDIFMVEVLDTEKLTLMAYLDDKANSYQNQYGDLNPEFVATLNVYVTNNANVANQVWMQLQNKAVSQGWELVKEYAAVPLLSKVAPAVVHFLNAEGVIQVPATTFLGVTLTAAQTAGIYLLVFNVTVDVAANPEGVYEQRILSYYQAKNAVE